MKLISQEKYLDFLKSHKSVTIEDTSLELVKEWNVDKFQPDNFTPEEWTVWSFPDRGNWATHQGNYRGNWSPYIPRNLIERYTKPGELVCDPMMGSGTTLVECRLTGRDGIGVDINPKACMIAMNRLDFHYSPLDAARNNTVLVYQGDARNLDEIKDDTVDLIATHPPYCGIISYSRSEVIGDLSALNMEEFVNDMRTVAKECFRILKPGKYCDILVGDTRRHRHHVPIHLGVLAKFLEAGFILKEDIIKLQHNTKMSRERWRGHKYDFYKIAHEHLFVFRKPELRENTSQLKYSKKWW